MKKILNILSIITLVGATSATVVACTTEANSSMNEKKIAFIKDYNTTEGSFYNDKAWSGVQNFLKQEDAKTYEAKSYDSEVSDDVIKQYSEAAKDNNKIVIGAGFNHYKYIQDFAKQDPEVFKQQLYIWLDANNKDLAETRNDNVANVIFSSVLSGFYAGIATSLFLNEKLAQTDTTLKTSAWIGEDVQGVSDFLVGYYSSIRFFNRWKSDLYIKDIYNAAFGVLEYELEEVQFVNPKTGARIDNHVKGVVPKDELGEASDWITNFEEDKAKALAKSAFDNNIQALMPVAGAQTEHWLNEVKDQPDYYAVGVNVDMSKEYTDYKDKFITSALKDLSSSTESILNVIKNRPFDVEANLQYEQYFFNNEPVENLDWSTIAENDSYSKLASSVMNGVNNDIDILNRQIIDLWYKEIVANTPDAKNIWMSEKVFTTVASWESVY